MSHYRRARAPGATYFFTLNTYRRHKLLTHPEVLAAFKEALRVVRERYPFHLDALVVMPDHLHALWTLPSGDDDYSTRWSIIKRRVSQAARHLVRDAGTSSRQRRLEIDFWRRRFWEHQIRDDVDYARHMDYAHHNPVKHDHVQRVRDWQFSTFHRYVREGVYPLDWGGTGANDEGDYGELSG